MAPYRIKCSLQLLIGFENDLSNIHLLLFLIFESNLPNHGFFSPHFPLYHHQTDFQRHYNSDVCKGAVSNLTAIGNLNLTATASSLQSSFNLTNAAALTSNPDTATNNYLSQASISNFITDNIDRLLSNAIQTNLSNSNQSELLTDSGLSIYNGTQPDTICRRDSSLLFILLMLGTVWMAVSLFNFNKT